MPESLRGYPFHTTTLQGIHDDLDLELICHMATYAKHGNDYRQSSYFPDLPATTRSVIWARGSAPSTHRSNSSTIKVKNLGWASTVMPPM